MSGGSFQRDDGLLFDWSRAKSHWRGILFWAVLIGIALVVLSTLIRVEAVVQAQRLSRAHSIILLDAGIEAATPLLNRAMDQSLLALGTDLPASMEAEAQKGLPTLRPSFLQTKLALKAPLSDASSTSRQYPQIISATTVLPPVQAPTPSSSPATFVSKAQRWTLVGSNKTGRKILQQTRVPDSVAGLSSSYHTAVDGKGRVLFSLPLFMDVNTSQMEQETLRQNLDSIRFQPSSAPEWHTLVLGAE